MYYYGPPQPSPGEQFGGCMTVLVILGIIFALVLYFGYFVLLFFLALGLLIGGVFSLVIYIRSLIDAIRELAASPPYASNKLLSILKGYALLVLKVTVNSFKETMTVVTNSFYKFLNYRVLSFQKWMWLTVVVTVAVCEVLFVIAISLLQVVVITALLYIIFWLVVAVLALNIIAALGYTLVLAFVDMLRGITTYLRMDHCTFSSSSTYPALIGAWGLMAQGKKDYIRTVWGDTIMRVRNFFTFSGAHRVLSIQKWFYLASGITMLICSIALNLVFLILYSIVFIPVWIVNALWTTGVVIFWRLHP